MLYELLLIGEWVWNIPLLMGLAVFSLVYLSFLKLLPDSTAFRKQTLFLLFALATLYLCIGSPFTQFSHLSFSLHMLQMSILYFVVPPLLLLGIPEPLFQRTLNLSFLKKISKLPLSPLVSLILFAVLFTSYHLPVVLNFISQHVLLQNSYSFLMFALSLGMWWPLTAPDPKQRLKGKRMKRFALLSGLILMPACLLLILNVLFAQIHNPFLAQITAHICFPLESSSINILPPFFNSKLDQFIAGVLMLFMHKFSIMTFIRISGRLSKEISPNTRLEFHEIRKVEGKA